ncbi:MAG: hypothetical protein A2075_03360 [Geobacteraceae bacterium GWC2_58_44]|nr:MAG: hypothetical protein A2075_03360 [Geobacteraceae bacterium GWC2_58_44]HBG05830.1 hypothetical protein [Geobacter sp.]
MTSKHLKTISDRLSSLHGHAYFRPQDGPLMKTLANELLDAVDGELAEQLSEGGFDLEVSISHQEGDSDPTVSFSVDRPGVAHTSKIAATQLNDGALEDLAGYLTRLVEESAPAEPAVAGKTVLRKTPEGDHHEKGPASARLKVSAEWLKSVVPCTDYSYDEIDGKKYIREYFWSRDLIERLFRIKSTKTTPEDLQFVAQECCDGDLDWARDLIARLKSPNRPEPAAKEQPQKNQGRQAQNQGKPAASPGQSLNKTAQAKAVPGERVRPRSRHKKPFREQGKDAARKPEPAAGQKPPQG